MLGKGAHYEDARAGEKESMKKFRLSQMPSKKREREGEESKKQS